MAGEDARLREHATGFIIAAHRHHWGVWLDLHEIENLAVTVEKHDAGLKHVLEDEILVVVADLNYVTLDKVIEGSLPLSRLLVCLCVVVDLLLRDLSIEDLFVHTCAQAVRNATLCILHKERLVVLGEKALSNQDSFVDE